MGLPIKDGGKSLATIASLEKELEVNALDVATFQEEVTQAQQALDNFTTYYETQSDLLE